MDQKNAEKKSVLLKDNFFVFYNCLHYQGRCNISLIQEFRSTKKLPITYMKWYSCIISNTAFDDYQFLDKKS